jgi:acetylornithine deacetylase/succinyl-diaminopimelate desuccinylase-like protein
MLDPARARNFVDRLWTEEAVPTLVDYIRIPNKSPAFDADWAVHGHMDKAVALFEGWARPRVDRLQGATLEVIRLPNRTPVILIEVPGSGDDPVLLYGHLDKQPEMVGWADGMGPWTPVLDGDKLYGRGGADDGYAMFGALAAILALHEQGAPHRRCVLLIEACEESGSGDLPFYVEHLAARIGTPSLVVCLDSGCGNYDQLWLTTSLRGLMNATLTVRVLEEGVHSGNASGVVPSSFRILRHLLSRLEDERTGEILPATLQAEVPPDRLTEAQRAAAALGHDVHSHFPLAPGVQPTTSDPAELVLNRTWRPQLTIVGMDGFPPIQNAGNVLLPFTAAKLSLRLPPTLDGEKAAEIVSKLLLEEPPYGARVEFALESSVGGWNAPALEPWLGAAIDRGSELAFGRPAALMGEGASIPFMTMLGERFPKAQFVITGVLGPHSNAHGPNEFLHIPTARSLSLALASILAEHYSRPG